MERRRFETWFDRHYRILLTISLIGLVALAWYHRFMQDDAFISFRYADNLLHGNGLVWNPGERVEGYSNFLWTLLMAAGMWMGIDPVPWSQLLGILSFALSLYFTFRLASLCFNSRYIACMTILLLGWNFTFHSFATGGLETQFQTCLFVMLGYLMVRMNCGDEPAARPLLGFSLCSAVAILTRLDSVIICGFLSGYILIRVLWPETGSKTKGKNIVLLLIPQIFILVPWLVWKQWYYGQILPNSFYLKASAAFSGYVIHGIRYLDLFLISYGLLPLCVVGLVAVRRWLKEGNRFLLLVSIMILVWVVYIITIGGDFMEFRMLVPIMPFMFLLISWIIFFYLRPVAVRVLFVLLILAGSMYHQMTFTYHQSDGIEPVGQLAGHLDREDENWIGIGRLLDSLFAGDRSVIIATTAAGAIPFYSKLPTIDMLGVNDPWIVRHGVPISTMAGHQVIAPVSYLLRKHVNLVISHPLVVPRMQPVGYALLVPMDMRLCRDSIQVVEFPLTGGYKVVVWYLQRQKTVDEIVERNKMAIYPLASLDD